jgi:branched-chain amino acid transport system permease protein
MRVLLTLVLLGLTVGSMYALFAVSFGLIFNVTHIFHLAHGAVVVLSGYLLYLLVARAFWPTWLAVPAAIVAAALLGAAIEVGIYRPLRRAGAPSVALFLTSVGVLVVAEGLLGALFGPGVVVFRFLPLNPVHVGPADLTTANVAMLFAWPLVGLAVAFLVGSRSGRFLRAVADTPSVARLIGIDLERSYVVSFLVGSALAVPATLMYAWYQGLTPVTGLSTILVSSAAVIIGGRTGILPGALAALGLGIVQAVAIVLLPSGWQDAVVTTWPRSPSSSRSSSCSPRR